MLDYWWFMLHQIIMMIEPLITKWRLMIWRIIFALFLYFWRQLLSINVTGYYVGLLIIHNTMKSTFSTLDAEISDVLTIWHSIFMNLIILYISQHTQVFYGNNDILYFYINVLVQLIIPIIQILICGTSITPHDSSILVTSITIMVILLVNDDSSFCLYLYFYWYQYL